MRGAAGAASAAVALALALAGCGAEAEPPVRGDRVVAAFAGNLEAGDVRLELGRDQSAATLRSATGPDAGAMRAVQLEPGEADKLFAALDRGAGEAEPCAVTRIPAPEEISVRLRYAGRTVSCPYSDLSQADLRIATGLLLAIVARG